MTWLFIPSPFAPASADSTSESVLPDPTRAASLTWRGKQAPPLLWSRRWKRGGFIRLLSGLICEPSTLEHGAAQWIASCLGTRASSQEQWFSLTPATNRLKSWRWAILSSPTLGAGVELLTSCSARESRSDACRELASLASLLPTGIHSSLAHEDRSGTISAGATFETLGRLTGSRPERSATAPTISHKSFQMNETEMCHQPRSGCLADGLPMAGVSKEKAEEPALSKGSVAARSSFVAEGMRSKTCVRAFDLLASNGGRTISGQRPDLLSPTALCGICSTSSGMALPGNAFRVGCWSCPRPKRPRFWMAISVATGAAIRSRDALPLLGNRLHWGQRCLLSVRMAWWLPSDARQCRRSASSKEEPSANEISGILAFPTAIDRRSSNVNTVGNYAERANRPVSATSSILVWPMTKATSQTALSSTTAKATAWPESDSASLTTDGCSTAQSKCSTPAGRILSSGKTSPVTRKGSSQSPFQHWSDWAAALRSEYSARRKRERATDASDCSFWPTARVVSGGANSNRAARGAGGPDLQEFAQTLWMTPRVTTGDYTRDAGNPNKPRLTLEGEAKHWPTPAARGANSEAHITTNGTGRMHMGQLPNAVEHAFPHLPPAPATPDGPTSSQPAPTSPRRLNPAFVEWLMGWPTGLSGFGTAAMESCPSPQPMPGCDCMPCWLATQRAMLAALLDRAEASAENRASADGAAVRVAA